MKTFHIPLNCYDEEGQCTLTKEEQKKFCFKCNACECVNFVNFVTILINTLFKF